MYVFYIAGFVRIYYNTSMKYEITIKFYEGALKGLIIHIISSVPRQLGVFCQAVTSNFAEILECKPHLIQNTACSSV